MHQYTVGMSASGKSKHLSLEAEDALIAALRIKARYPDAAITYVRRSNMRGDRRHPQPAE